MSANRWARILVLVSSAAVAGSAFPADDPGKERPPQAERKDEKRKPPRAGRPAGVPAPPPAAEAPAAKEAVRVYTNDDLDRLPPDPLARRRTPATKGAASEDAGKAPALPDPLQQIEDQRAKEAAAKAQIAEAERKVAAAESRVRDLEKRALEIKNPYLPRPEAPPDQAAAWKGMSGTERLKVTEEELRQARQAVGDAKAGLDRLRADAGIH